MNCHGDRRLPEIGDYQPPKLTSQPVCPFCNCSATKIKIKCNRDEWTHKCSCGKEYRIIVHNEKNLLKFHTVF